MQTVPPDSLQELVSMAVVAASGVQQTNNLLETVKFIFSALMGGGVTLGGVLWKLSAWKATQENKISSHDEKINSVNLALSVAIEKMGVTLDKILSSFEEIKDEIHEQRVSNLTDFVRHDELNGCTNRVDAQIKEIFQAINELRNNKADKNTCALHFSDRYQLSKGRDPV